MDSHRGPSGATLPHAPLSAPARRRRSGRTLAAGLVLLVGLVLIRVLAPVTGAVEIGDLVQDFLTLSISVIIESLPFVFLGIGISVIVQFWVPSWVLLRILPRTPALRRLVLSFLGVLLPVCECGNVPLSRGLIIRGISVPETLTFLVAAPIVNPVTILTTYYAFGFDDGILVARILGGLAIANLVGWLFSRHPNPDALLTRRFAATCTIAHERAADAAGGGRVRRSVASFAEETTDLLPVLFIGAAIAGFIQVAISRDVLLTLGQNPVWSVFALMLLAFVVALCSNVDAFFILAFGSTFMPGAIVAFLVFGPVIDIKMIALLRTTFTTRALLLLSLVIGLATAALGLGMNLA
jgi:uncharacterized membrane protein YraQ (UPF0718 family)